MDSVTQAALGAAIGGAIAPPGQRRKALLVGAALGTLPDLDVLVDYVIYLSWRGQVERSLLFEAGELDFTDDEAAKAIQIDDRLGLVAPGYLADLVLVDENPLENLKVLYGTGAVKLMDDGTVARVGGIKYVVKDGIVYDAKKLLEDVAALAPVTCIPGGHTGLRPCPRRGPGLDGRPGDAAREGRAACRCTARRPGRRCGLERGAGRGMQLSRRHTIVKR